MLPTAEPTRVEIDLTRQVLFFWQDAKLVRILPVSSGFGGHYCGDDGSCGIATTPIGAFHATSKIKGIHKSPLGELWDPVFFNGGIAIHGEPSVPASPASHGCVRIPMNDSTWMYTSLNLGTPVYVADSTHVPVPFNQGGTEGPRQPGGTPPTVPAHDHHPPQGDDDRARRHHDDAEDHDQRQADDTDADPEDEPPRPSSPDDDRPLTP